MPSFLDYVSTLGPEAVNAYLQRRTAGSVSGTLQGGVNNASGQITRTGADLQKLYGDTRGQIAQTGQNISALYDPYKKLGTDNLDALTAGLKPGGGLADSYGKQFSFTGADLPTDPGYETSLAQGEKAIEAARRALGTRFSGGAVKASIDYNVGSANQHFNDAFQRGLTTFNSNENTFRTNQKDRFDRLTGVVNTGLTAASGDASAQLNTGNQLLANNSADAASRLITGQQLADLQQQKAAAIAAGDQGKANALQNAIEGGLKGISALKTQDLLKGFLTPKTAAPLLTGASLLPGGIAGAGGTALAGTAAAGTAAAGTAGLGVTGASVGLAPALPGMALGGGLTGASTASGSAFGAGGTWAGGSTAATAGGGSGIGGAATAFLQNPATIAIGAGLIGLYALHKSQVHPQANEFVQKYQKPFGDKLVQSVQAFNQAAQSGQLTQAQGQQFVQEIQQQLQQFQQTTATFGAKGSHQKTVARQAVAQMDANFGPGFSKLLSDLNAQVQGLPQGAA